MSTIPLILKREAQAVFAILSQTDEQRYPDCWAACTRLRDRLINLTAQSVDKLTHACINIQEIFIQQTSYRHYILRVKHNDTEYIVDPTFGQFATDRDSPAAVAPADTISDVIVAERHEYFFAENLP